MIELLEEWRECWTGRLETVDSAKTGSFLFLLFSNRAAVYQAANSLAGDATRYGIRSSLVPIREGRATGGTILSHEATGMAEGVCMDGRRPTGAGGALAVGGCWKRRQWAYDWAWEGDE